LLYIKGFKEKMNKIKLKLNKFIKKAKSQKKLYLKYLSKKITLIKADFKDGLVVGNLNQHQIRIVILTGLIIFSGYFVLIKQYYYQNFLQIAKVEQKSVQQLRIEELQKDLGQIVKGHPIEVMIPYIAQKDRETAAYMIGIAKKESNWGKRKPVLDGEDCYNYWGFRAKRERMGSGGHTCFDNPKDAVDAISKRVSQIIERNDAKSAKNLIVWKCGSNCAVTGGQAAADKWIADVDMYAKKVLN